MRMPIVLCTFQNMAMRYLIFLFFIASVAEAQNQLVVLRGERVLFRYKEGDMLSVKTRSGITLKGYVADVNDSLVITLRDTIRLHDIDRVYATRITFSNKLGIFLMMGGTGYFLVDEFNTIVVQGKRPDVDAGVARASAGLVAGGAVLFWVRKHTHPIRRRVILRSVDRTSVFYEPERGFPRGYVTPYIPR